MTASYDDIRDAFHMIANYFTDYYEHTDRDGTVETRNGLAFPQMIALGAIPQQLTWNLRNRLEPMLEEAKGKCFVARLNNSGTEIAKRKLGREIDAYKRVQEKIMLQETAIAAACEVYAERQGKEWTYYDAAGSNGGSATAGIPLAAVDEEFERLFGSAPVGTSYRTERDLADEPKLNEEDTRERVAMEQLADHMGRPRKSGKAKA